MWGDHHACARFRIRISRRVKIQLVVPARTAVLLTAVLATIITDIIAQIVPSADSSSSSSGCLFISWLLFIRESGQGQERPYHVDRTTSRLLCEVKRRWARLVLRWGTT